MTTRGSRPTSVRLSVLDRLLDDEPGELRDPEAEWETSLAAYRAAVMRDLEWLLNTRRFPDPGPLDDFPELQSSLLCYGPPDVTSLSGDSSVTRRRLLRQMEELIRTFEPRLTSVRVRLDNEGEGSARQMRFSIQALLRIDEETERVSFDTVLEIASGRFVISGGADA